MIVLRKKSIITRHPNGLTEDTYGYDLETRHVRANLKHAPRKSGAAALPDPILDDPQRSRPVIMSDSIQSEIREYGAWSPPSSSHLCSHDCFRSMLRWFVVRTLVPILLFLGALFRGIPSTTCGVVSHTIKEF